MLPGGAGLTRQNDPMENPYRPTAQSALLAQPFIHWKRIVAWSLLILLAVNVVGTSSGLTMARWEIYGGTIDEAIANSRLIRRIASGMIAVILYWRFATGLPARRTLHVVAAFALVHFMDAGVSFFVFGVPVRELIERWALVRDFLAAVTGLGIAHWHSRISLKATLMRGREVIIETVERNHPRK